MAMDRDVVHQQLAHSVRHMLQSHETESRIRERLNNERLAGLRSSLKLGEREQLEKALAAAGTKLDATVHEFCDQLLDAIAATSSEDAHMRAGA